MNKSKKPYKFIEESDWDCSVCTYRNTHEAFKCLMCNVRKGTSTRKPKINSHLAAHHVIPQYSNNTPKTIKKDAEHLEKRKKKSKKIWRPPKLKNVDRNSAEEREITINNSTILITEFKMKDKRKYGEHFEQLSTSEISSQSESGFDTSSSTSNKISRS